MTAIAVIVPTFHDTGKLLACLDAVHEAVPQGATVDVIVIDDAHDPSVARKLMARFPALIVLPSARPGSGGEVARAHGVRYALENTRAEIVAFTDADCRPSRDWLRSAIHVLERGDNNVVTGPVIHGESFARQLTALVDFGELQARSRGTVNTYPGCNVVMRRQILGTYPYMPYPYADRLHSWKLASTGEAIAYDPEVVVFHDPDVTLASLMRRRMRYGAVTMSVRRQDPTVPGGSVLTVGPLAPFILAAVRVMIDLRRLFVLRSGLAIAVWKLPLFVIGIIGCRSLDCYGMLRNMLTPLPVHDDS